MSVPHEMLHAAIKQAVKEKLLPTHAPIATYEKHWAAMERILDAALYEQETTYLIEETPELFEGTNDALDKLNIKG